MCRRVMYVVAIMMLGLAPANLVYGGPAGDPDLLGWWSCDEGAGTVVGDVSGNGHDGTFVDGDPAWTAGIHGSAVELVAPTLVEIPALDVVLSEATMAGWMKPNGSQTDWSSFIMHRGPGPAHGFNILGFQLAYHWNDDSASWSYRGGDTIPDGEWTFCAVTVEPDKATFYVNGVAGSVNTITHAPATWDGNLYFGGDITYTSGRRMTGALDDISFFSRALTEDEILAVMQGIGSYPKAIGPDPADGAMLQGTWVTLNWRPGDYAVSHDVYLGDNFDDVDNGTGDTFRGNQGSTMLIAGFAGFPYPDGLVPGTTYYWRIDEVNDTEPNSPWKGDIWSFSIPPKTAYNPDPADGAEFVDPNATFSWTGGFGAKLHTVYMGANFDDVSNAAGGTPLGSASYSPGTLESEKVYYWRVDEFDPPLTHKGDIWSFTTPGAVGDPQPANGAADVQMNATLNWTAADNAASHELYFGADADAVKNATTASPEYIGPKSLGAESYDPGELAWNSSYAWRVDEVYPAETVKGLVWSFTTADFILVDDFESYNDIDPPDAASKRIFDVWIDGFGVSANGALVGNDLPPYAEQSTVHGGAQSMPYLYDNANKTSEATLTLVYPRDWTAEGVTKLALWFRGASGNAADRMFVALGNAVVYHDDASATQITGWNEWVIDLTAFAGVDLTNVNTITIGIGTKGSPAAGGAGQMYFDDLRLTR
ncbi:MAG: LamG domain-containing protein [Planctomycetota bacterium]|nr:LamG domain-containing protein [Planctomycetota bacterium]